MYCRTKKFASNRRRGKLTRHLLCVDEDNNPAWCFKASDGRMATCLPPDLRKSRNIKVRNSACFTDWVSFGVINVMVNLQDSCTGDSGAIPGFDTNFSKFLFCCPFKCQEFRAPCMLHVCVYER